MGADAGQLLFTAAVASIHNLRLISSNAKETRFFAAAITLLCMLFVGYNLFGYVIGFGHFVRLTFGFFAEYAQPALIQDWKLPSSAFIALYIIALMSVVCGAVSLALSTISLIVKNFEIFDPENACIVIREKLLAVRFCFYLSSLLISSAMIFIFSWHHVVRTGMTSQTEMIEFTQFMLSFSAYWGLSYSFIILFTFVPVCLVKNLQIYEFARVRASTDKVKVSTYLELNGIQPFILNDFTFVLTTFAPLLTGFATNAISLGVWDIL
ncbi:hypothetical protein AYJ57_21045 (plasmid) [Salipiger sp. CCB-MM3]|uniref:hypothetical protein n=1 Tax=Salipiger sp. CCB-MM3 TaxID=1792508 RepID=UPI00080ABCC3|nr:hypothetical protein [Salipiger sp. CCB-MM3]ANT62966.1 hypothetical protein AYJ57_21045 [Salipiger sp. CCB-MM3]